MAERPKVLVVVHSSGEHPFLEIEVQAQEPTFGSERNSLADVIWVEANSTLSRRSYFRLLDRLLGRIHRNISGHTLQVTVGVHTYFLENMRLRRVRRQGDEIDRQKAFSMKTNLAFHFGKLSSLVGASNVFSRSLMRLLGSLTTGGVQKTGRRVQIDFPNSYFLGTMRAFLIYELVVTSHEFDFVLFTTSTCYVDLAKLIAFVDSLPRKGVYGGHEMQLSVPFVAGNSILMSRDVVEQVVLHKKHYRLDLPTDVALGFLVRDCSLAKITHIATETLPFSAEIPNDLSPNWRNAYLFRCKAGTKTTDPGPVIATMEELHAFILTTRRQ